MESFYNPYHFVPVKPNNRNDDISKKQFTEGDIGHISHARYLSSTGKDRSVPVYSGRLMCRLTTKAPVVIGNERQINEEKGNINRDNIVSPFKLEEKPAIPASTIRGLISSIAEAASNSSLRVLGKKYYEASAFPRKGKISLGTSYDYFSQISKELLPFNNSREIITIAEQLFGFTEQSDDPGTKNTGALALASRLRFSFGILSKEMREPYFEAKVLLKILDAPKPPCPSLYFYRQDGSYISKEQLNPVICKPQGRKFYLHPWINSGKSWETKRLEKAEKQQCWVTPIKPYSSFYFHIDFDNISLRELSLLCYAIRPSSKFHHKLGMGKPIGLGKVCIDPIGIFYIDRVSRYRNDFVEWKLDRYHAAWVAAGEKPENWPDIYINEQKCFTKALNKHPTFDILRASFIDNMDADIRRAIELIGDPDSLKYPVHYPQFAGISGDAMELEIFKWFMENKKPKNQQTLKPITRKSIELPALRRTSKPEKEGWQRKSFR